MAYQIRCDDYILHDHRDEELVVLNPKCKLKANAVGDASFTILANHPYYGKLKKLKSIFEIRQDNHPIFRGRMTGDSRNLHNQYQVDLEGVLAFTNDSIVSPFSFPDGFPEAEGAANMVEFFLKWLIEDVHNGQVEDWQKLKVGTVTVTDPNNIITRSSEKFISTWEALKSKLFESELGGYLCPRYEEDGTYIDYLASFPLTNTQRITLGENLLDIQSDSDASETYSAILPLGADVEDENGNKYTLTLADLPDGDLTDDLVKKGLFIYSKSAVEQYGWVCVPVSDATWTDVTLVQNLKTKAMNYLTGTGMLLSNTITIKAVDLHFTNEQIQAIRVFRNLLVDSPAHDVSDASFPLTELDLDLSSVQNTTITIGATGRSLVDVNRKDLAGTIQRVESAEKDIAENRSDVAYVKNQLVIQSTQIMNDCEQIILSALKKYVETSNFEEFQSTVASEFKLMADKMTVNFETTTEQIKDVNGDLQSVVENMSKHFEFTVDGLVIKAGENTMNLLLDNDLIRFMKNGQEFGWWDGVDFHTGNIVVEVNERAQFGNFAFVPRSNGSLSFLKVGG